MAASPPRVLFVCLGNICRSPAADGVLRRKAAAAGLAVEVDSCGIGGWHAGEAPDPRMCAHAKRRGYDLAPLRARQLREADFRDFDVILGMDEENVAALHAKKPRNASCRVLDLFLRYTAPAGFEGCGEVPDPYYGGAAGFDKVLDMVEAGCDVLVAQLWRRSSGITAAESQTERRRQVAVIRPDVRLKRGGLASRSGECCQPGSLSGP